MDVLGNERREGLGRKSTSGVGGLLLLLVSFFLLLSSLYAAEASVFQKAREAALDAASPVLKVFAGPAAFVQDVVGAVSDYFFVLEQNKALREEIAALREWEREARELRALIASYETIEAYYPPPSGAVVNASVIGESNDAFVHTMIVNAGRAAGVAAGQAVVDDRGLVGHIVHASTKAARVLLLTDVQSNIAVYVDGAEVEGILSGRNRARPAIAFTRFDDIDRIRPGQRVATSGVGGRLPRGLPIGVVAAVRGEEAFVALDANFARTRLVRIIDYGFPDVDETDLVEAGPREDAPADESGDAPALEAALEVARPPATPRIAASVRRARISPAVEVSPGVEISPAVEVAPAVEIALGAESAEGGGDGN